MDQSSAELLALKALGWMAGEDEVFPAFLGASGLSAGDLRGAAGDVGVLAGVLDFLVQSDDWVTGFCRTAGETPEAVMRARAALGGGDVHWT